MNDSASIKLRRGDYQTALDEFQGALALKRKVLSPDHPDIGISWVNIGETRARLGDYEGALEAIDNALAVCRHAYGPGNTLQGWILGNRGEVLESLGRHAEAEQDLRASIDLWREQVGPDHPWVAHPLTALGKTLISQRRRAEAIFVLEQALRIRERSEPNVALVAETRFALARALWEAPDERTRCRTFAVAALNAYRTLPTYGKQATEVSSWLAKHAAPPGRN
jgi:tetratricopeptide (TPR) repeat protein